jgi:hypothetical protein
MFLSASNVDIQLDWCKIAARQAFDELPSRRRAP